MKFIIKYLKKVYSDYIVIRTYLLAKIEKLRGVDFSQELTIEELGLNKETSLYYGTAGSFRIKRIISKLKITKNDSFLDIGCGKGKIMYEMSKRFQFRRVDGVEISNKLCDIAEKNLIKLKISNYKIFNFNAKDFKELDDYNYIYFANPFPAIIMRDVMQNIEKSVVKAPRTLTIIYFNPVCHKEIIESGIFVNIKNKWNVSLYRNIINEND